MIDLSEEALNAAIIRELCSGRQLMESMEKMRDMDASRVAEDYRKRGIRRNDTLRHIAEVPQWEYFQIGEKYGYEAFNDRGFLKDMQRLEPSWASNKNVL